MNEQDNKKSDANKESGRESIVDAVFDLGTAWAAYGLNAGKQALEVSAKTLEKTAHILDTLKREIETPATHESQEKPAA